MPDGASTGCLHLDRTLTLAQAHDIVAGRLKPEISTDARHRCAASHRRLLSTIRERRHVYGLTTGFGPLANRLVDTADGIELQQNLIHHLASGQGPDFDWLSARAIVLARLMSILQGLSGASEESIASLLAVLQSPLAPAIPSRGTVGASGDLTPLAHLALCLQGRGAFFDASGQVWDGQAALDRIGIKPLDLEARDGLALVNGTSAMTGVALCNSGLSRRLLDWSIALTAGMSEAMGGRLEAWSLLFASARPHAGQMAATRALLSRVEGSGRLASAPLASRRLDRSDIVTEERVGQDAYTLRCAPQVIGAVWDTVDWHDDIVLTELASVTDNPIFPDMVEAPALHGGNFMGQHVGLASDALTNAVTVLAGLAERQVARLTDERLNQGLPAFLHKGRGGLNSGFMGAQVTATAILAELRTRGPASMQSISTNGANQDVVSMGTIAARMAADAACRTSEIQAILALCVAQAIDIVEESGSSGFSKAAESLRAFVRTRSAALDKDRPLGEEIEALAEAMRRSSPPP